MTAVDEADLRQWIGRTETARDTVTANPVAALRATLDYPDEPVPTGTVLPPLWHWLYFLPVHQQSELGPDGHPRRGGFLPPVALPRRMWAGGRLEFHSPLEVGDDIERTSTIDDVTTKTGRSGPLVFVTVRHEVRRAGAPGNPALVEYHDIVYRGEQRPGEPTPEPKPAPTGAAWHREVLGDAVLLFRYSALTFNGHRIHYDRQYVTEVEGYPGLVVHGPLLATLLVDLVRRHEPHRELAAFRFRAVRPVFDSRPFSVNGAPAGAEQGADTVRLWIADHDGWLAMDAAATVR
jgi:3-methylfumaryl-CoA hydratase